MNRAKLQPIFLSNVSSFTCIDGYDEVLVSHDEGVYTIKLLTPPPRLSILSRVVESWLFLESDVTWSCKNTPQKVIYHYLFLLSGGHFLAMPRVRVKEFLFNTVITKVRPRRP